MRVVNRKKHNQNWCKTKTGEADNNLTRFILRSADFSPLFRKMRTEVRGPRTLKPDLPRHKQSHSANHAHCKHEHEGDDESLD